MQIKQIYKEKQLKSQMVNLSRKILSKLSMRWHCIHGDGDCIHERTGNMGLWEI